jgi:hypothetical protein
MYRRTDLPDPKKVEEKDPLLELPRDKIFNSQAMSKSSESFA